VNPIGKKGNNKRNDKFPDARSIILLIMLFGMALLATFCYPTILTLAITWIPALIVLKAYIVLGLSDDEDDDANHRN